MPTNPLILLAVICLAAAAASILIPMAGANRKRQTASTLVKFVRDNFDALSGKEGIITQGSLHAARGKLLGNHAQISMLLGELDTIGHKIGSNHAAQGVAAVSTAMSDPSITPLVAASDWSSYGISKEDLDRVARIEVSRFGTVHVFKWRKQ